MNTRITARKRRKFLFTQGYTRMHECDEQNTEPTAASSKGAGQTARCARTIKCFLELNTNG